jgi:uncharacterized protein (DUF983 family)
MSDKPAHPSPLHTALHCKCPRCGRGELYQGTSFFNLDLVAACSACHYPIGKSDNADGPAVALIFILGTLLVPLAFLLEVLIHPPLWVHAIIWSIITLLITIGALKPLKALVISLNFKYRTPDNDGASGNKE